MSTASDPVCRCATCVCPNRVHPKAVDGTCWLCANAYHRAPPAGWSMTTALWLGCDCTSAPAEMERDCCCEDGTACYITHPLAAAEAPGRVAALEAALLDIGTERDMAEAYYPTLERHLREHGCEHDFADVAARA